MTGFDFALFFLYSKLLETDILSHQGNQLLFMIEKSTSRF
jgi:hypothetical protein